MDKSKLEMIIRHCVMLGMFICGTILILSGKDGIIGAILAGIAVFYTGVNVDRKLLNGRK